MEDRRDIHRRHLMLHLHVYDADSDQQIGALTDISPDGLMLTGDHPLTVGRRYRMLMRLPAVLSAEERIEFVASVAWSSNEVSPAFWDTGFRDLELDEQDRQALETLMDEFDLREAE